MVRLNEVRAGEVAIDPPAPIDAGLVFIGRIRTPWISRLETPRLGRLDGPDCTIEIFEPWRAALKGIEAYERIEVLFFMHLSRRDLVLQSPANDGRAYGTFALRSPVRPNPIGTTIARLIRVEDGVLTVRGLDCIDGTPLIDIKPDRTLFTPIAPEQKGDREVGGEGGQRHCRKRRAAETGTPEAPGISHVILRCSTAGRASKDGSPGPHGEHPSRPGSCRAPQDDGAREDMTAEAARSAAPIRDRRKALRPHRQPPIRRHGRA